MKQLLWLLFVSLFVELWLSLEAAPCQNFGNDGLRTSFCCDTGSGKTCFKTFHANNTHLVSRPFKEASSWCKLHFPGSSLIIINSIESQGTVESFIGRQVLQSETIITDAQKLSANESLKWSWVNGHSKVPREIESRAEHSEQLHDGACVESKHGQSLAYCVGNVRSQYRYICEYSDSKSESRHQQNNKRYVASEEVATWYDARNECLRLGGDLASITDLRTIGNWTRLKEIQNQRYWIGLHRNKWIWNSTGDALTYTNWKDGYPDESSYKQCICINPRCRIDKNRTICGYDRKWRICNCNHNYAIVCQKEEESDAVTTAIVATEEMPPSTSTTRSRSATSSTSAIATTTSNSTETSITTIPTTTTTSTKTPILTTPPTTITSTKAPIATTPTTTTTVATTTPLKPVISTYTTPIIADNTAGTIDGKSVSISSMQSSNHFSQNQTTDFVPVYTGQFNSSNTKEILLVILLFVAVVFIVAAVILIIRKRRYDRRNEEFPTRNTKHSETVSSVYATVVPVNRPSEGIVPPGNTIYAEVEMTKQSTPPSNITNNASVQPTSDFSVIYAGPNKPTKSSTPTDKAVEAADPIYLEAIEVKAGAESGDVATQDPSAVYAEPIKVKKLS